MRTALIAFFALHSLSASMAFGLPWVLAWFSRRREAAAKGLTALTLVNLSAAVVLGVGVLLFVSMARPKPFVASAVAHFFPMMAVVPLLGLSYAALYAWQLKGWRPGPPLAGLFIAGVAGVFATIATGGVLPRAILAWVHFAAGAFVTTGIAVMVRFHDTEEARLGARAAFAGAVGQLLTGGVRRLVLEEAARASFDRVIWAVLAGSAALLVALGILGFSRRVSRTSAWLMAAGIAVVTLMMSVVRESGRPG